MIIERDVPIPADDGLLLRADIFRPDGDTPSPTIMTLGPYGKGVQYSDGYAAQWNWMNEKHPNWLSPSRKQYMTWETVDPELWTSWGYTVIRVDSRGSGRTPGRLDIFGPREVQDFYDAIEWAGTQPWSNGKIGLCGISYYAINQWLVASLQPPHLTAMIPWEGSADAYRDWHRHGGIASNAFAESWYAKQVISNQYGNPNGRWDPWLDQRATGSEALTEEELTNNRCNPVDDLIARPLIGDYHKDRSADWSKIVVPFLSAANSGGMGLHNRGNFEGFARAASKQKWLSIHSGRHDEAFYLDYAVALQRKFFDYFLKGVNNGWLDQPPVVMQLRYPDKPAGEFRHETKWPIARTKWTKLFLSSSESNLKLTPTAPQHQQSATFDALGDELRFSTILERDTEISGPSKAHLFISSSTKDADLFITIQAFAPDGKEVDFQGAWDPHTPLAQGWLRASHRKLDLSLTTEYRPYHTHDEIQPLSPGRIYEMDVEIWNTVIVLPAGYELVILIGGKDFQRTAPADTKLTWRERGAGPFLHNHPADRGSDDYKGRTTVYAGDDCQSYLQLPIIEN